MIKEETTETEIFDTFVDSQRKKVANWLCNKYEKLPAQDAEEIVLDAVFKLWNKELKYEASWKPGQYNGLIRVYAKNQYLNWYKKEKRRKDAEIPLGSYPFLDSFADMEHRHRMEKMYWLIDHMEPNDREFMKLYLQNVRMDEIARRLGLKNAQVAKNKKRKLVVRLHNEVINGQALDACPFFSAYSFPFTTYSLLWLAWSSRNLPSLQNPASSFLAV